MHTYFHEYDLLYVELFSLFDASNLATLVMCLHKYLLFFSVPIIFFDQSVYEVTEEERSVAVTVLSNGEHITSVNFNISVTNISAIGEANQFT